MGQVIADQDDWRSSLSVPSIDCLEWKEVIKERSYGRLVSAYSQLVAGEEDRDRQCVQKCNDNPRIDSLDVFNGIRSSPDQLAPRFFQPGRAKRCRPDNRQVDYAGRFECVTVKEGG